MKLKITYKEITVALGILVALLVVMTMWSWTPIEQESRNSINMPSLSAPKISTQAIKATLDVIF